MHRSKSGPFMSRFGSEADFTRSLGYVRFTPESGHAADVSRPRFRL